LSSIFHKNVCIIDQTEIIIATEARYTARSCFALMAAAIWLSRHQLLQTSRSLPNHSQTARHRGNNINARQTYNCTSNNRR